MSARTADAARRVSAAALSRVSAAPKARVTAGAERRVTAQLTALLLLLAVPLSAQQQITLDQAIAMANKQGHRAAAAVAARDASRAGNTSYFRRNLPQFSLTGQAPRYEKSITAVIQQDGSTAFVPVQQTTANAGLTVSQRIPFTGADFSITSSLQRYERSGNNANLTWSSTPVRFQIVQPILQPNQWRWQGRIEDVELTVAERQYLEAREEVALTTSNAFFDFYIAKRSLDNAVFNAATNDTLYNLNKGRLEIGKIGENDLLQSELALLNARATLDNARLEFDRAAAQFRLALNLAPGTDIDVSIPLEIPIVNADTAIAVEQALKNRAQISQLELQDLQARRAVANARLGGGPNANITAGFGLNQTASDMNLVYQNPLESQAFTLGVNIPLLSWGARGADVQQARMTARAVEANARASREQLAQDAHFAALQLSLARRNVELSAKADTVAQKRFEVAYNRYVIGRIGVDNLYIAQNEKDRAVTQYLQALKNYWAAYYRLRQVTLYDFEAGRGLD